ncbi:MAG: antibiotic biosynthesis monooxygenase [Gammaproteobacteria bacterium]|nr:antibiotic biosynthesis monooxygenase [Gammaproteobacteria bacterium]MBU1440855.1 antibiotic biosynthesis monooxygenase [Gammaproteobacteria bacterium]MBU2284882.1 antibiotic biosynthesis monooxygenase [Gammaproteobacteria bacterium]
MDKILRTWTFWIRSDLRDECREHLEATKLKEMRAATGNHRAAALFRDREDGTTVVVVMSVWDSMESIRAFSGGDHEQPSIDPADLKKIFDRDHRVGHYSMSDVNVRAMLPPEWRADADD